MKKRIELLQQLRQMPLHTRPIMTDEFFGSGKMTNSKILLPHLFSNRRKEAIMDFMEENIDKTAYAAITEYTGPAHQFRVINDNVINEIKIVAVARNPEVPVVCYVIGDSEEKHWIEYPYIIVGEYSDVAKAVELEYEIMKQDEEQEMPIFKMAD